MVVDEKPLTLAMKAIGRSGVLGWGWVLIVVAGCLYYVSRHRIIARLTVKERPDEDDNLSLFRDWLKQPKLCQRTTLAVQSGKLHDKRHNSE